jgi:exo beta-1,2-glucooligosaccharide sophorohydrolase (non-reducing end)
MAELRTASIYAFRPEYLASVIFRQGRADGKRHVLIVDEIRVDDDGEARAARELRTPVKVTATGYDRHIVVRWEDGGKDAPARYVILRSLEGGPFTPIGIQLPDVHRYSDWLGKANVKAAYEVAAEDWEYRRSEPSDPASAETREMSDEELLTMLRGGGVRVLLGGRREPHSGMAHENMCRRRCAHRRHGGFGGWGIGALVVGGGAGVHQRAAQGLERPGEGYVRFLEQAPTAITAPGRTTWTDATGQDDGGVRDAATTAATWWRPSFLMQGLAGRRGSIFTGPSARERASRMRTHHEAVGEAWSGTGIASMRRAQSLHLLALVAGVELRRSIIR